MRIMSRNFYRPKINPREKWILFWFWIFILLDIVAPCPKVCQCKWRNGKQWVTCTNAKFIDIPRGLEPSTQVLNLQHNNLKILFTDAFYDRGIINLQKVFLSDCKLRKLEKGSLRKLTNLIEINLNSNFLTLVPSDSLRDVPGLRELEMKENNLTYLDKDAFSVTPNLVLLDVSFNNITAIHDQAFRSLTRLEVLKISGNRISTLSVEILKPLVALHGFHVHFNPWNCNCILRPLRQWMIQRNIAASIPPRCSFPERLKGNQWKTLEINEFVCIPKVTAVASRVMAANGDNVSLSCSIGRDPEVEVTWQVGDRLISKATDTGEQRYKVLELIVPEQNEVKRVSNLTIAGAALHDQGTYICVVENKAGRVETNMTLQVSEVIIEEPFVAVNEMFIAGTVLGALAFVLISVIVVSLILCKRSVQLENEIAKLNCGEKRPLPFDHFTDDKEKETPLNFNLKSVKHYEYESIPTSEIADEPSVNNENEGALKTKDDVLNDILNDLDQSDNEACVRNITSNILHSDMPKNISYVEIPKSQLSHDQNPLLKNLAEQCQDEILRRKGLKMARTGLREKGNQFPDLLDFPADKQHTYDNLPKRSSTASDITTVDTAAEAQRKWNPSLPSTPVLPDYKEFPENKAARSHVPEGEESSARRQSLSLPPGSAFDLDFHAAQLQHFLQEYKILQDQLLRMKETGMCYTEKDSELLQEKIKYPSIPARGFS